MTENGNDRDPIGTVADEARKLIGAIQDRAAREVGKHVGKQVGKSVFDTFTGGSGARKEQDVWGEAVSEPHEEYICRACPVCRAIAAQREAGGDVTGHLAAASGELFAAVRGALDLLGRPAPRGPRDRPAGGWEAGQDGGRGEHRHGDDVEHIDLG
ncbi:hypothetical protein [Nonomuraea longicatena]|uniref:Uncharacterized protein n=1 Tax=Nonomuraea longicatena TaxID=83682 RepID=A0ABN1PS61_9ACTN